MAIFSFRVLALNWENTLAAPSSVDIYVQAGEAICILLGVIKVKLKSLV